MALAPRLPTATADRDNGPVRRAGSDLLVDVRLTPKGGRDAIDGVNALADGRQVLAARVRAVPEDGKANAALVALMADLAGLPRSSIAVVAGATARVKTLRLLDVDAGAEAVLRARLARPGSADAAAVTRRR